MSDRPTLFDEMAAALGPEGADAVVREWGGVPLWVPQVIRPGHPIAAALGLDTARRLATWCGGETLRVPIAAAPRRAVRDDAIRSERARGVPAAELARRHNITVGRIYQILKQV